jgi:hypothetical protein
VLKRRSVSLWLNAAIFDAAKPLSARKRDIKYCSPATCTLSYMLIVNMGNSVKLSKPSYSEVALPEFSPLTVYVMLIVLLALAKFDIVCRPLNEIRRAIPPHLLKRDTIRSILYLLRDLTMATIAWRVATYIDPCFHCTGVRGVLTGPLAELGRWGAWCI